MTLPARVAILNRLTDVGRETALQVGKLCARHRATIPFSQRSAWSPTSASAPPAEAYAVFSDNINQDSVKRVFNGLAGAMANKIAHVHLLFQSSGGFVGDGICL